jgi:hypothetical protein
VRQPGLIKAVEGPVLSDSSFHCDLAASLG